MKSIGWVAAVVVGGGGEVGPAEQAGQADGQVAQAGHDARDCSGPDSAGVPAVGDVADVVQGLDTPLATDQSGELSVGDPARWEAGDRVDLAGAVVGAAAFDLNGLGGVRKGQAGPFRSALHAADLTAAVPGFVGTVVEDGLALGQGLEPALQGGLVAFDDEQVVAAGGGDVASVFLLGVQGVGGDHHMREVQSGQQGRERGASRCSWPRSATGPRWSGCRVGWRPAGGLWCRRYGCRAGSCRRRPDL